MVLLPETLKGRIRGRVKVLVPVSVDTPEAPPRRPEAVPPVTVTVPTTRSGARPVRPTPVGGGDGVEEGPCRTLFGETTGGPDTG